MINASPSLPVTTPDAEMESWLADTRELLLELVSIGAPTFQELRRAKFIEQWLQKHTTALVGRDEVGNVWADMSGGVGSALHLFDAHIDTVCPDETITVIDDGEKWRAPGILDNGACCALLMTWVARLSQAHGPLPMIATFTVCEEGLGNLIGINQILERFGPRLKDAWMLDLQLGRAARQALGSKRYKLSWETRGGHSWNDFGNANAIVQASLWIADFASRFPWQAGKQSFNIGTVLGGTAVNVIAASAECTLEVRSPDPLFLKKVDEWLSADSEQQKGSSGVTFSVECIGTRPAGEIGPDHTMVAILKQIHEEFSLPLNFGISGTNANAVFARGIPAITTGLATGGGIHSREEFLDVSSLHAGALKLRRMTELVLDQDGLERFATSG